MGYIIKYGKGHTQSISKQRKWWFIGWMLLLFSICIRLFMPDFCQYIQQAVLTESFIQAAQAVVALVSEGGNVGDAVSVFCQELIHGS